MKALIVLCLSITLNGFASDISKFEGDYELIQGNCPMDINIESLAGHALYLRDINNGGKSFLQFSGIGQGTQTMYQHDWSSKTCYKAEIYGNTVKYESESDVSIYRPCWSVSMNTLYSIKLQRGTLEVETLRKSCSYSKITN